MNCKSCRRRKIKCNRLKPTCEACNIFQCPCIYDAVPKKRGPKTEANMLEALLKRFDGLEKKLENDKSIATTTSPTTQNLEAPTSPETSENHSRSPEIRRTSFTDQQRIEPTTPQQLPEEIVDVYFTKIHGKPYTVLEETSFRQLNQLKQLPTCLVFAVSAVTMRYARSLTHQQVARSIAEQYANQARVLVDVDEPSIESLQTLLLLSMAYYAAGKGKKAYTTLYNSVSMAYAMELHRESPTNAELSPTDRELRRRLFWSCYIMDRFNNCGSKRPSIISDSTIRLKLPSYAPHAAAMPAEGKPFNDGPNLQFSHDPSRQEQGAITLLIDIVRILGLTNHYIAGGGVAGDHHFPWHSGSTLSKIRNELNIWAASTQNCFASVESVFGHAESTTLFLSKLVYHLTHILIYRNFLPINLNELRGTGQHQSWQIEATTQCFVHANLTAELVEMGRRDLCMEWPAFVGYCICTAGSVHVHGHHYQGQAGEVFSLSGHYLQKEYDQLTMLSSIWAGVGHQKKTLEAIAAFHSQLVSSQDGQVQFSPVYLEDFFDRYPGFVFEGPHVSFQNISDLEDQKPGPWPFSQLTFQDSIHTKPIQPTLAHRRSSQMTTVQASQKSNSEQQDMFKSGFSNQQQQFQANIVAQDRSGAITGATAKLSSTQNVTKEAAPFSSPFSFSPSLAFASTFKGNMHDIMDASSPFTFPFSPVTLDDIPTYCTSRGSVLFSNGQPAQYQAESSRVHEPPSVDIQSQNGSHLTPASEGDPFLKLLEELAQNEQNQGGPSELDFFLNPTMNDTVDPQTG